MYLNKQGEPNPDNGGGSPCLFDFKRNYNNFSIKI